MKKINIVTQLSLLERYLISEIIPILLFNIIIVTVVTESIGISFEQFNFLFNQQISFNDLIYLHILKLPEFIVISAPISILMTTILVYNKLSNTSEIIALQSCGVSLYKLLSPVINLSIIIGLILFIGNDFIVPATNYKAAITLESLMNINRESLKNDDVVYQELAKINEQKISNKNKYLKYLFYAEKFSNGKMSNVTLLIRDTQGLKVIINSKFAALYDYKKCFYFYDGVKSIINPDGSYGEAIKFEKLMIDLPNISRQFQLDREKLDDREMNIFQIYQRLLVAEKLGYTTKIIKLKLNLFKRFNLPISCIVFSLLGSAIGINLQPRIKYNSFSLTLVIIGLMKIFEAMINALILSENISIFAIWLPNIFATGVSFYLLQKKIVKLLG
ncbi:LptF/LptG family permease [Sphaerospermopsis sp. LEGE 08334]|jgi:lipopolysaccharide export system permease protein|uniref:LptF/LptG family permease n=1 Tax=Sphaerospermopsis sp. LEGE 08334 TaxID=1828651 RepID=UPI001881FBED|nr:LptF/LptG family permease [Sphaerospermopsis sp. LEGE 08334]MBE9055369.1 LptF/LptG family permease [Sphaerospermopsis sp. LEGE 08334]